MKKILLAPFVALLFLATFIHPSNAFAQGEESEIGGIIRFSPAGVIVNTLKGPFTFNNYAIRIGGEYPFNDKVSIGGSFDIGFPDFGRKFFYLRPEARYYITGVAPTGFYAGGFFQYGNIASSFHHIGVGASTGWQEAWVNNHLILDLNIQMGYGGLMANGFSNNGFLFFPSASVGYGF